VNDPLSVPADFARSASAIRPRLGLATIALFTWLALLTGPASPAAAQSTSTPTAGQLEVFRNLPPDQQRMILEQMSKGSTGRGRVPDRQVDFPETTEPRAAAGEETADTERLRERKPRLQSNDTVVLDVAVRNVEEEVFPPEPVRAQTEARKEEPVGRSPTEPAVLGQTASERREREALRKKRAERTEEQEQALKELVQRLLDGNPYKLDRSGTLGLPGIPSILLAGLTEEQATKRLASDPALAGLRVKLTLLPVDPQGADALKPFGYDIFSRRPTTFALATDVPVPPDYAIGPGDSLEVQIVGSAPGTYSLVVGRDGKIQLPQLGPVAVAGMRFTEARQAIEERVESQMIGSRAVVSVGQLRSITVFVTGEAELPGAYTLSGLSTVTNALFATGGVKEIGSLRNIQLRRGGALVATLDLYDLLLRGDAGNDVRLMSGDVVFIPPVGASAGVAGEVRRPAIYEFKGETTAADLLRLAGGLTPDADSRLATLERITDRRERVMQDLDLSTSGGRATHLQAGDLLRVRSVPPAFSNAVTLQGHVHRPGAAAWREGLRLTDLLPAPDHLKPNADLGYVLVRRETQDRLVSAVSADLARAWLEPASDANLLLMPRDQVIVFDLEGGRELSLKPILDDLRRQSQIGRLAPVVTVGGRVKLPGDYPYEEGMTVSDLVRAGGGLSEAAYGGNAELTRSEIVGGEYKQRETLEIDLGRLLAGEAGADLPLRPLDYLVIKELPQWSEQEIVTLSGEVRFPGKYPIRRGETLGALLKRAGGLTELAFPEGSVFTRESLKEREARQLEQLANRLEGDLASLALQATQTISPTGGQSATQAVAVGRSLLESLRELEPVGRLVIDLERVAAAQPGSFDDLTLKGGDRLIVPQRMQEVTVVGEVQSPTSHLWNPEFERNDYVRLSGGATQKADDGRIYVVRADGSVATAKGRFGGGGGTEIRPGDTIIVPLDAERMRPLPLWTAVTTIIYNLAVAVAAVNSF
jgi:protein involved in polysaccharide export with SLBB domain